MLTAVKNVVKHIQTAAYNDTHTVDAIKCTFGGQFGCFRAKALSMLQGPKKLQGSLAK